MQHQSSVHQADQDLGQAIAIWHAAVDSVKGDTAVRRALISYPQKTWSHMLAIGKAASSMMLGARTALSEGGSGLVITKFEHVDDELLTDARIRVMESAHPIPDQSSLDGGQSALDFISAMPADANLLVLVSGGASALLELPLEGIDLDSLQQLSSSLLAEGYSIDQINAVRVQISRIKGGKLLRHFGGKQIDVYGLSDIPGDNADLIGSGIAAINPPLPPDFQLPEIVQSVFDKVQTPADEQQEIAFVFNSILVGSNSIARDAAKRYAEELGLEVVESLEIIDGDIMPLATKLAQRLQHGQQGVYIWGGEPTVTLPDNPGDGGRNQSLALALANAAVTGSEFEYCAVVAGTDGTDGPTNAAGGLIDFGMDMSGSVDAIQRADAGRWLQQAGSLFVTGPTGTNVMDLIVVIKR